MSLYAAPVARRLQVPLLPLVILLWLLLGASMPRQGSPDGTQIQVHDAITRAIIAPVLAGAVANVTKVIFSPVIPSDPEGYFNGQQAPVQH